MAKIIDGVIQGGPNIRVEINGIVFTEGQTTQSKANRQNRDAEHRNGAVGSVEGSKTSKSVENDRPKACRANHDALQRMRYCPTFCSVCRERLSS